MKKIKYRDCVILFNSERLKDTPFRIAVMHIEDQTGLTDFMFLKSIGGVFLDAQTDDKVTIYTRIIFDMDDLAFAGHDKREIAFEMGRIEEFEEAVKWSETPEGEKVIADIINAQIAREKQFAH